MDRIRLENRLAVAISSNRGRTCWAGVRTKPALVTESVAASARFGWAWLAFLVLALLLSSIPSPPSAVGSTTPSGTASIDVNPPLSFPHLPFGPATAARSLPPAGTAIVASFEINDSASCQSTGATWANYTCNYNAYTFLPGGQWVFTVSVAFRGPVTVWGNLWFEPDPEELSPIVSLRNVLTVEKGASLNCICLFLMFSGSGVVNEGTFGLGTAVSSTSFNSGTLRISNRSTFSNDAPGTVSIGNCGHYCYVWAGVSVEDGGGMINYGLVVNAGRFTVSCGARWDNHGKMEVINGGTVSVDTGPTCVTLGPVWGRTGWPGAAATTSGHAASSGDISISDGSGISIPYNATFDNRGTLTLESGASICVGFNGTLSNSGSILLERGDPSQLLSPGSINNLDCGGYYPGHPVANSGTIYDAGNISGDVSGSGSMQILCGGTAYRNLGTTSGSNGCRTTKVSIIPRTPLTVARGYVALDAVVVDTGTAPVPPVGTVSWSGSAVGGAFVQNGVCTLAPISTNSSACAALYRAPASNGAVAINASYDQGSFADEFAPVSGVANLTVGAAQVTTLSGKTSCLNLGGRWNSTGSTCSMAQLTVGGNASLTVSHGVTLQVTSLLNVSGVIDVWGNLTAQGAVENRGTVSSNGTVWVASGARWTNDGLLQLSQSPLLVDGTLDNDVMLYDAPSACSGCPGVLGNVTNRGLLETQAGAAFIDSVSSLAASGAVVNTASGTIVENGSWTVSPIVSSSGIVAEGSTGGLVLNGGFDNFGNLSIRGELTSSVGAPLRDERSAVAYNFGALVDLPLQNLGGATFWNRANATLNLTGVSSNAGVLQNSAGASIGLGHLAQLANQAGGILRNPAGGQVVNWGSLLDAGALTNSAGGQLFNGYLINVSATGSISDGGTIENSAPSAAYPGVLPPAGTIIVSGNLTGSGVVNDTVGSIDTPCAGAVTVPVVGHPPQSACGDPTITALTPQQIVGTVNQSQKFTASVLDTLRKGASPPVGNVTFALGTGGDGPPFAVCTLSRSSNNSSSCSVSYSPPTSGEGSVTAQYLGNWSHRSSTAYAGLLVEGRPTSGMVIASKSTVRAGGSLTFRMNVSDPGTGSRSAPTGLVFWDDLGTGGSFAAATCTLKAVNATTSSCSVAYRAPYMNGNDSVTGTYVGDAVHRGGPGSMTIAVGVPCSCHAWQSPTPQYSGNFGLAVAVSGGRTVVGAPNENSSAGTLTGIAYVINTTTGSLISTLISPNASYSGSFGDAVAISGDLVVVGAPLEGNAAGHAYLYNATSGKLLHAWRSPSGQATSYFGSAVAIDGRTAVVGAPYESVPFNGTNVSEAGRAYEYSSTTGKLLRTFFDPKPFYSDEFGYALALNGTRLLVGQPQYNSVYSPYGPGHAFLYNSSSGGLVARLSSSHPRSGGYFGSAVALDPTLAVVGAYDENTGSTTGGGRAYVFDASNGTALAGLRSPHAVFAGRFGFAVAAVGSTVIVGAPDESAYGHRGAGNAYEFSSNGTLLSTLVGPGVTSYFGYSVAASGARVAVGAPYQLVEGHIAAGRVFVF